MRKSMILVIAVAMILVLAAACTPAPAVSTDADEMEKEPTEEMTKDTDDMDEAPAEEMAEEPGEDAMEEEKEEMAEEPKEEMIEEPKEEMETAVMGIVTEAGYIDLTPEEAKTLFDTTPDLVILDVSPKYDAGHLPGAINHYVGDGSLDAAIPDLDKEVPYLVYCHVDSASISGSTKLVEAGFDPVYRLIGNYSAWVDAGYPVEQ